MITVVLNGYRRPHTLQEQYDAVKSQTVEDIDILFWGNYDPSSMEQFPAEVIETAQQPFVIKTLASGLGLPLP